MAEMVGNFAGFHPSPRLRRGDRPGGAGRQGPRATHTLSGGQQRRLDVALGLIGGPELLYLDEPAAGFDPAARRAFGKIIQVLVAAVAEVAVLLVVGLAFYHLRLPGAAAWWTFAWVFVLGVAACSLLGIAASSVPRSAARNGVAVITFPFVILQFISGVYVPFFLVPTWLRDIASVFPLEWMCRACARYSCRRPSPWSPGTPGSTARPRWCYRPGSAQDWCCA